MEIETILGYSDAIDATIFTGTYPDIHGYFMKYSYDPENSPFNSSILRFFRIIDYIPSSFIKSGINYILYKTFYKWLSKKLGYYELASFNIPYNILHYFDFVLKKSLMDEKVFNVPTIFDVLRINNKTFYYSHGIKSNTFKELKRADLNIIYLSNVDFSAHLFGIDSPKFFKSLRKLDKKIEAIFNFCKENIPNASIIVFSDHGMAKVHEILDFGNLLNKGKGFQTRYLLALDGTMIRFWYFDENIKLEIREFFKDKEYGYFLTKEDKNKLRIIFTNNRYGDDIFLLDQGYAIFPNFMSWAKPKAMHAYHPKYKEQRGVFILHGRYAKNLRRIKLVDIMPTFLDILELPCAPTVEGKSILV